MPLPALEALKTRLVSYVEAEPGIDVDEAAEEALQLVTDLILTDVDPEDTETINELMARVPAPAGRRACLEVGADLYYRRMSRNGIVNINSGTVEPVRINRNPLTPAYPILRPYLGAGIA